MSGTDDNIFARSRRDCINPLLIGFEIPGAKKRDVLFSTPLISETLAGQQQITPRWPPEEPLQPALRLPAAL